MYEYSIGWFGMPGRTGGKTHIVNRYTKPLCGHKHHELSQFQWCSRDHTSYIVECCKCRQKQLKLLKQNVSRKTNKI